MEKIEVVFLESSLELMDNRLLDIGESRKKIRKDSGKRGRPDIVHVSLLNLMEKPFVLNGNVEVFVHIYDDRVFKLSNNIRLPKNYERFKGLMRQLLLYEKVPPGSKDPLIWKVSDSLDEYLNGKRIILLSEDGIPSNIDDVIRLSSSTGYPIGIGAFSHGGFSKRVSANVYEAFSLYNGVKLKAWDVSCLLSSKLFEIFSSRIR